MRSKRRFTNLFTDVNDDDNDDDGNKSVLSKRLDATRSAHMSRYCA